MARYADWEKVPMAEGGSDPLWPMPKVTPKFATWSLGGGRPSSCAVDKCERWHAGVDLTSAPDKALVVAPEDGTIAALDKGWTEGTRAIFFVTDSGLFLVLGGVIAGSHKEWGRKVGAKVARGGELGRIVGSYGMLHFETYAATPGRTANSRWWQDDPPPEGLLNPANYVERMVGKDASLLLTRQRLQALADLGYYKGDVGAAWGTEATEALKTAQAALGVAVDGKWGPHTEDAIQNAMEKGPCNSLEDCGAGSTSSGASSDALSPMRIVGGVVAGLTLAGLTAAVVVSMRRRPAPEEAAP
jgi:hypothetical protein